MKDTQDLFVVAPIGNLAGDSFQALLDVNSDDLLNLAYAKRIAAGDGKVDSRRSRNVQETRDFHVTVGAAGVSFGRTKVTVKSEEVIFQNFR